MSKEDRGSGKRDAGARSEPGHGSNGRREVRVIIPDELPVLTPEVSRILLEILMELAQDKEHLSHMGQHDEQVL
jgi:hypothetical protein